MDLKELRGRIEGRKTIEDVVLAIIYKANPKSVKQKKSKALLQKKFFEIKDKSNGLLDSLIFDCSTTPPYCDKLGEALFRLETSRSLSTLNPSYQDYSLEGKSDLMQKVYDKFSEEEKAIIDSLGKEVEKSFG